MAQLGKLLVQVKKFLYIVLIIEFLIIIFTLFYPLKITLETDYFLENESYQLAKWSKGTYGGICYQYADRLKRLFGDEVRKEHIIIKRAGNTLFAHYRIILFENENIIIYTDSNFIGEGIINTWYEHK